MKREIGDYVEDIIDAMDKAMEFVKEMSYDEFIRDDKSSFAAVRAIEIMGEAVKNIPQGVKKKRLSIPWREMAGMRDKIIHEYFGIDSKIVWETVKERIPKIRPLFEEMLKDIEDIDKEI